VARAIAANGPRSLAMLAGENPMDWLSEKPRNYLGEFYSPDLKEIPCGNWLFDRAGKTLIYLSDSHKSFPSETSNTLMFKVKLLGSLDPATQHGPSGAATGLVLDQIGEELAVNNQAKSACSAPFIRRS